MIKCNFLISLGCTRCRRNRVQKYSLFEWAPEAELVVYCYGNRTEQPTKCPDAQWFAVYQCYLEYGIWRGYERHCSPSPIEGKGALLLNHLELSRMFSTVTHAIAARPRFHLKDRLLIIIGRTFFRQKIAVTSYWGWSSGGQHAKSARPVSRGAKRRTLLPWPTQSWATWLSPRVSAATIASASLTVRSVVFY